MKPRIFQAVAALVFFAAMRCDAQANALWQRPLPAPDDANAQHFANGAVMLGDITYKTVVGYRQLKLDLYLPSKNLTSQSLPLVIWVHGGGWQSGTPREDWVYGDWSQILARLAARGYAVAGVSYRFSQEAAYPAQIDDVHAAIRFLRKNAAQWGIDPGRVYIWGASAGGHLASLAGTQSAILQPEDRVQGVVDWFGPVDLTVLDSKGPNNSMATLFRCPESGCADDVLRKASPVTYISAQTPPTLIMQGDADKLVPLAQSQEFNDRLKAAGVQVKFLHFPGQGHGFVGGTPAEQQQDLDTVFAFLDQLAHSKQ